MRHGARKKIYDKHARYQPKAKTGGKVKLLTKKQQAHRRNKHNANALQMPWDMPMGTISSTFESRKNEIP